MFNVFGQDTEPQFALSGLVSILLKCMYGTVICKALWALKKVESSSK